MSDFINPKDPVVEKTPEAWTSEQEMLAKDSLVVLKRHYKDYKWGIEFSENVNNQLGVMIIRLLDVPTDTCYVINPKDIDRDRLTVVMRAGGEMLEALGLRVGSARGDDVRGLKRTPAGLIVPDYAAVPETNPGYERIKRDFNKLNR